MQKNYILIVLLSLLGLQSLLAQSPASFNYQAVPRKQDSLLYSAGQILQFRFQIREGSSGGNVVFAETNNLSVNRQGAVNTAIGFGASLSGLPHDLQVVNWGSNTYYLSVDMDVNNNGNFESDENFGTSQLLSVPFAMYAAKSGSGGGGGSDAQTLSVSGTQLSISNGNTVNLPLNTYQAGSGVNILGQTISANDESPSNELQNLSINGNQLSISNGNMVQLPATNIQAGSGVTIVGQTINANDASPSNELQNLSINGSQLSISNGNMVQLPAANYNAGSGVYIFGQTISAYDESPNNELQDLSISGNQLTISNGNTITLPSGGSGLTLPYNGSGNNNTHLFTVTNNGGGSAIHGINNGGVHAAIFGEDLAGGLAGVYGISTGGYGVWGNSASSFGLVGQSTNSIGVLAQSLSLANPALLVQNVGGGSAAKFEGNVTIDGTAGNAMNVTGQANFNDGLRIGSAETIKDGGGFMFEMNGTVRSSANNADDLGTLDFRWNTVYAANGTINTSDARLKRDIKPLGYGIDEVMKLQPVSYQWIDGRSGEGRIMGFLAQDLQKVIPEVVRDKEWVYDTEDRSSGHWKPSSTLGVAYSEIIPVAVAAIQEQQKQIDALRTELVASEKQQQAQAALFRAELEALKKQMK